MTESLIVDQETHNASLPEHLVQLNGSQWALWRCAGLRGAGFPAEQALELAAPQCAAIADRLIRTQAKLPDARKAAHDALHQTLREIEADSEERQATKRALRRVNKYKLPEPLEFTYTGQAQVEAFRQTCLEVDAMQADFEQAFAAATEQVSQTIYQVACTDRFREAVAWQNRHALITGIRPIIRKPPGTISRGSKRRQHEELVANYLQRYCVKNDTIGFFGPVGWASLVSQKDALNVHPGPDLLADRSVYFEVWCIDALARILARNEALRPWIAPRRRPSIYLDGTTLYQPFKDPLELSAEQAAVLRACNGRQTAREIAQQLAQLASLDLGSEATVYDLLKQLESKQWIAWTLEVPIEVQPEQTLRHLLERVEDERLYQLNMRALDVLEKARSNVASAAGDAEKLDQALHVMNTVFARLTGESPTRAEGQTYAARTLVYEDCRRDIEVNIGPQILQSLGPSLSLLLDSARWFTIEAGATYRQVAYQFYDELAAQAGSPIIPLAHAWPKLQPILLGQDTHPLESLSAAFQERWTQVLSIPAGVRRVAYTSQELRPRIREAFTSSQPEQAFTCYQTPDIMIAAPSVKAIQRGDYQFVMGELHMCINTLQASLFMTQHPFPEKILRMQEIDRPEPRVVPITPKQWPDITARTMPAFVSSYDFRLALTHDLCDNPESHILPIGAMVIEKGNDGLLVRTRDGRLCFDIIQVIAELVPGQIVNRFKILDTGSHTPRVTIDRLVISRETWRFPVEELTFAYEKEEADRFLACRRWTQQHDLPRFVFAKTPIERKPFYIDFDSPILVNILAKYVRRTNELGDDDAQITVTEMLPDPSQLWLPDAQGQHYTSELRIVAVDLEAIMPGR